MNKRAKELNIKIHKLLNESTYEKTWDILNKALNDFTTLYNNDFELLTEITGGYISLGMESHNKDAINQGLLLLTKHWNSLQTVATNESLYYFLGNAKHALYRIYINENLPYKYPTPQVSKEYLFDAKSSYFKVYKTIDLNKLDKFSSSVLQNLANTLDVNGRIVEALQLYDSVLRTNPNHPQSLISKAQTLIHMVRTTKFPKSLSFYATIYSLFDAGEKYPMPRDVKQEAKEGKEAVLKILLANNFNLRTVNSEFLRNHHEFGNHLPTVKFNLENFLSLSEHGLFCYCNGARVDNLTIGLPNEKTSDKKLMRLEALLNRLKSEFSFARQLYYDYKYVDGRDNIYYQDLLDSVQHGLNIEWLRNSFRMCFGILDKIAEGVCYMLDLPKGKRDYIYFESFWEKHPPRWKKLNTYENIHLTALYSIGSDLNKDGGEFYFYKNWRNKLEHGVFSLRNDSIDRFNLLEEEVFSTFTNVEEFSIKTLHILQLTRSAIFSFVFCARHELKDIAVEKQINNKKSL